MALQVWLPMTKDLRNQGLSDVTVTNNGATFDSAGKLGGCYSFDGNDDFISLDGSILYDVIKGGESPFSIAMWIYRADSTRAILFGDYSLSGSIGFNIELNANHSMRFYWNGTPDTSGSHTLATLNAWTHLAITYDGTKICFYTNGTLTDTYTVTLTTKTKTSGMYYLGRDSRTGSTALNGKMNDFRLYDHCLSPMEVKQLSQGLVLHYPLDNNGWGQENLLKNSTFLQQSTSWNRNGVPFSTDYSFNGRCVGTLTPSSGATSRQNMGQYITTMFADLNNLSMVTCSFWYKAEVGANTNGVGVMLRIANSNSQYNDVIVPSGLTVDGAWHYKMYTVDLSRFNNTNITSVSFLIFCQGAPVSYSMLKLELGSIATPWCPNSSDTLYTTLGYNDNIEYDTSGFGNNGTRVGELSWSTDTPKYLASTVFDTDISKYIKDVYAIKGLTMDEITVSLWFNTSSSSESVSGDGENLFSFAYNSGLRARIPKNSTNTIWLYDGTAYTFASNTSFVDGKWHLLVITFDNGIYKCFIDGIQIGSNGTKSTSTITFADNEYYRIATSQIGGEHFVGKISDFRIYANCLSPLDVLSLYQASAYIDSQGNTYASSYVEG